MKPKIIILGAGYAGIMAANRLDKQLDEVEIILISESNIFQERIRNHETTVQEKRKNYQIKDLLRTRVKFLQARITNILPSEKSVLLEGKSEPLFYDYLILCLGSTGIQKKSNFEHSIQSQEAVSKFLKDSKQKEIQNLCIIGGGLTGIEMATEWKHYRPHSSVTIVDRNEWGTSFSQKAKDYLQSYLFQNQIQILDNVKIETISAKEIIFQNQTKLSFDVLFNCCGFHCSPLPKQAGFPTNERNQVYVDPFLRAIGHPEVFVAGDLAYLETSYLRMGCVTALPMGAYIADHLANLIQGKNISPFSFQFFGRCISLGRNEGLIQFTYNDDKPKEKIIKGKWGARIKEMVNRFTIFSLKMEKLLPFRFYFWPKGNPIQMENKLQKNPVPIGV
ncbi:NADH-quinone oxidoreductase subunit D [Leptospira bourretii]|uniref:NADH-quinone oxidoreductase subunit D n=1 Tax=Leptospira bourretii TaxID=2484962 RepID=A0A4R9IMY9_9LEPT|nr:FAD-dependent oxidoreductase [Leptospira bourretii]TGK85250.1 NADH-quinone oxidoreductase subunit D [Leptospira bourretii]TGK91012.1 NADH-quinone oxidoreductase subunit D [Leptospira bourretii]TGL17729.1 NADH-quinone oxidoreductase subunit D [Leptospira bourretii]TGL41223.1 NADH-quinone oxidoreductase subunit D [Leptospira bourretii]